MDLTETGLGKVWSGFTWLRLGPLAGSRECSDEPSGSGTMEFVSHSESLTYNINKSSLLCYIMSCYSR
jgi:hypothetical protein